MWERGGPGSPGEDIVTDGGGGRVSQWIAEQVMILRVKHSLGTLFCTSSLVVTLDKVVTLG